MKKLPEIKLSSLNMPLGMKEVLATMAQKGSPRISLISAVAGAGIDVVAATRDERAYLSELATEYRPEIAERLGLAEHQLTEEHYQMAYAENPVLAQAKEVSQMQAGTRWVNSILAVVSGALAGLGVAVLTRRAQSGKKQADAANIASGVASTMGAATAGKVLRKVLHTSHLDEAMEKTAHHKIMQIKGMQQRGEETTAADIFEVQLALNPQVGDAIYEATGVRFMDMPPNQKDSFLRNQFPEIYEADHEMARLINEEGLRPQQLVFGEVRDVERPAKIEPLAPGHPDLPPNAARPEAGFVQRLAEQREKQQGAEKQL